MREDDKIVCICCPHCGAVNQKSVVTRSTIVCDNCKHPFWAMAEDGFVLTYELESKTKVAPNIDMLSSYHSKLTKLVPEK